MNARRMCTRCGKDKPASAFYARNGGLLSRWCKQCTIDATMVNRRENPGRQRAQRRVAAALKSGALVQPATCDACAKRRPLVAHHEDYRKPLAVTFLCHACRTRRHVELGRRAPRVSTK